MKALRWQRFLEDQRRRHDKRVFTVTELAHVAGASIPVVKVEAGRLVKQGILVRYARGCYGLPDAVRPEDLLPSLDAHAYLTGAYALNRHGIITQVPAEVVCFTNRRHNRSRVRRTAVGRFTFVCVSSRVYSPPAEGLLAGPAQALHDFVYLALRRGADPRALATFRKLETIPDGARAALENRYPATARRLVCSLLHSTGHGRTRLRSREGTTRTRTPLRTKRHAAGAKIHGQAGALRGH